MFQFRIVQVSLTLVVITSLAAGNTVQTKESKSDLPRATSMANLAATVITALNRGNAADARDAAQLLVLANPRSSQSHLLLAASHHLAGDPASLDQALSGYGAARQFAGNDIWPSLLAGMVALQRSQQGLAQEYFASAALVDPEQPLAFEGLAAAAYAGGNLALAEGAAERARKLNSGSAIGWRMAALTAAGRGDGMRVKTLLDQPPALLPAVERNWVAQRSRALLRTAAVDQKIAQTPGEADALADSVSTVDPAAVQAGQQQLTVDVTLILSDDTRSKATGVNLLDGLQGIFSLGRLFTGTRIDDGPYAGTTTLTRAIRIPDITYNLNIFNRGARYYDVVARPSLTAFAGEQSTFFVGEQLNVQVSGVNVAQLEKIDVGIGLKITPNQIREDGAKIRVEADRSFFSDQGIGSFAQGITTFKQNVAATADVRFGETLILSGLSESVIDGQESRTPVLGDIPVTNLLFSRKTQIKRSRSVLILVTPTRPAGIAHKSDPSPALKQLIELWDTVIERDHGREALIKRIKHSPKFTRAAAGDIVLRSISDPLVLKPLISSLDRIGNSNSDSNTH